MAAVAISTPGPNAFRRPPHSFFPTIESSTSSETEWHWGEWRTTGTCQYLFHLDLQYSRRVDIAKGKLREDIYPVTIVRCFVLKFLAL